MIHQYRRELVPEIPICQNKIFGLKPEVSVQDFWGGKCDQISILEKKLFGSLCRRWIVAEQDWGGRLNEVLLNIKR